MLMISVGEVLNILEEYAVCTPDEEKSLIQRINQTSMFIDNIGTVSKWISVKDRLPDDKELYLICTESNFGKIDIAYYQPIGDKFSNYEPFWQGRSSRSTRVTHWMPLPELPESDDVSWVDDDTLPNEDMIPDNEFIGRF